MLLVDEKPVDDFLVSDRGFPVWPVRNHEDRVALETVVRLFGGRIESITGLPLSTSTSRPVSGDVLAIGAHAKSVGELYAHLTGRTVRMAASPESVFEETHPPDVVLVDPDRLTTRLLRAANTRSDHATGLISTLEVDRFHRLALVRAAAATLCGEHFPESVPCRVEFWTDGEGDEISDDAGRVVLGRRALPERVKEALASRAALTTVLAHSDGIDAVLGDVFVCAVKDRGIDGAHGRVAMCISSGRCHRLRTPIADALPDGRLVGASGIAARVMLWNTCHGIYGADSVLASSWSFGANLASSYGVGALVTTWALSMARPDMVFAIGDRLYEGQSVGEALVATRREFAEKVGSTLCLLGDPRTRALRGWRMSLPPLVDIRGGTNDGYVHMRDPRASAQTSPCGLLVARISAERTLAEGTRPTDGVVRRQRMRAAATAVLDFVERFQAGWRMEGDVGEVDELQRAIASLAIARAVTRWPTDWIAHATVMKLHGHRCAECGEISDAYVGDLGEAGIRRMVVCPTCDRADDWHIGIEVDLRATPEGIRDTSGWRSTRPWHALVKVLGPSDYDEDGLLVWWPHTSEGGMAPITATDEWPKGAVTINAALVGVEGVVVSQRRVWRNVV